MPQRHHRIDGDQLADRELGYPGAQLVDPTDCLVSHHLAGVAAPVLPRVAVEVRAADAGGDHCDHDFARSWLRLGPFLNRDVVEIAQYERSHGPYLVVLCTPRAASACSWVTYLASISSRRPASTSLAFLKSAVEANSTAARMAPMEREYRPAFPP